MKRTLSRPSLGFLLIGAAFAISPLMTLAQTCPSAPAKGGRICTTPGAPCSPVTDGVGDKGKCTTEGPITDVRSCECKGAPPPSYNITLAPLTPSSLTDPAGGTATSTITVNPLNGFTGAVNFTCAVSGGRPPIPTCPNPASVTIVSGPITSGLSVTADKLTTIGTYTVTVTALDANGSPPNDGAQSLSLPVDHHYGVGGGGGGIALLTLSALLALWSMGRLVRRKSVNFR
jgi:hypothetical protein